MPPTADIIPAETLADPNVREPLELASQAKALTVTRENKVQAERFILDLNAAEKRVRSVLDPICDATHRAWKTATEKRAEVLRPIEDARSQLRRGCSVIQRVLDDEARAESRRRADEAAAAERERLEREAEAIAARGDVETAVEVLDDAKAVQPPPASTLKTEPPKAAGITYRDNWTFTYVDAKGRPTDQPDLSLIPREYLKVDEVAIRKVVTGLKDRTSIPGVRAYNDRQPVGSGGRR